MKLGERVEKAYKLLAIQENISNNEAKQLIDSGFVFSSGKKVLIARGLMNTNSKFVLKNINKPSILFEDENLIAINKPYGVTSEKISQIYNNTLLHRLDKDTSGVLLLVKNDKFAELAKNEFRAQNVEKIYLAAVKGIVSDELYIDEPILTIKGKGGAFSKLSKDGKSAITQVYPLMIVSKKSLVKVSIRTGRTHQIRVHLASAGYGIIGDEKYGKNQSDRMFLHSYSIKLFDYYFIAPVPTEFNSLGFEVSKNMKI